MASRKSRFDHLLFLEKVSECPFLYDINDANYKDMMLKEARWTEIGAGFNMTGQVAQLKWKSLRDRFTREKKKFEDLRKNSEDEVPPPKWWLFIVIGKMLDRTLDLPLLLTNGDGYENKVNDSYEQAGNLKSYGMKVSADDRSPFVSYRNNNNNSKSHHHLRNLRHNNNNNNTAETSRSSMCSVDNIESDSANPADESIAGATSATEISSAVHCEVSIEDDDDDDSNAPNASTNPFQNQHSNSQSYKRKRSHVEDTMTEWTYQLTNCLLQRIVEIYPPTAHGISSANQSSADTSSMDDVEYYVRSLGPRLRRLKAKDRGLVRLKIETALYDIESAVDE